MMNDAVCPRCHESVDQKALNCTKCGGKWLVSQSTIDAVEALHKFEFNRNHDLDSMTWNELARELVKTRSEIKWLKFDLDVSNRAVDILRAELGINKRSHHAKKPCGCNCNGCVIPDSSQHCLKAPCTRIRNRRKGAELTAASRYPNGRVKRKGVKPKAGINTVCICGSMRFYLQMLQTAEELTLDNEIVLMPFVRKDAFMQADVNHPGNIAEKLDALHKIKIDLSKRIVVVSDESGYYGDSTKSEIAYAEKQHKPVTFIKIENNR